MVYEAYSTSKMEQQIDMPYIFSAASFNTICLPIYESWYSVHVKYVNKK